MKVIISLYFWIGALFGAILEFSYFWAALYIIWNTGFLAGLIPAGLVVITGLFSAILRVFIWLPGFILWMANDQGYTFGMWLAPGFYVSGGIPAN